MSTHYMYVYFQGEIQKIAKRFGLLNALSKAMSVPPRMCIARSDCKSPIADLDINI